MRLLWSRHCPLLPGRGAPFLAKVWMVAAALALAGGAPGLPARAAGEAEPPARLSVEVFKLGGGVRAYVTPQLALSALAESKGEGTQSTGYAHVGLVLISAREFYDWETYGGAGATYEIPAQGPVGGGVWRPYLQVGAQFDIFFLEYHLTLDRKPGGWLRYGVRIVI
ncbi:MAG: hypothetical protein AB1609_00190 [Bacillota bacterium]